MEKPIIVFYLNVEGLAKQAAIEMVEKYIEDYNIEGFENIYIPTHTGETKVEVIWKGREAEEFNDKVNNLKAYSEYIAETVDKTITYSEYLAEQLENALEKIYLLENKL